jgi:tetratricopeptide (TPR) repeat protein
MQCHLSALLVGATTCYTPLPRRLMTPGQLCIVPRLMSRTADRAPSKIAFIAVLAAIAATAGCTELDGRNRVRTGNKHFREQRFIDSVAEYEKALKQVQSPIIHYNLGLAYSKVFKVGAKAEEKIVLGQKGELVCDNVPKVSFITEQVCIKPGDRRYDKCDEKNVCASSFKCERVELCQADNGNLADMSAEHFGEWLKANPTDAQTRGIMTQVWLDSSQYEKAITYWEKMLAEKPNDADIMGSLAGINLKAGDWRKSIEWYTKVAELSKDDSAKVAAYQFIGNVAWAKLNSKALTAAESIELADRGIGALQKAFELQPKNPKLVGLQASIYNFRSQAHGASWAAGLDRASAQDLQLVSRVLSDEAKKAQGLPVSPPGAPAAPAPAAPTQPTAPGPTAGSGSTPAGG